MEQWLWDFLIEQAAYIERLEQAVEELRDGIRAARDMLDGAEAAVEGAGLLLRE
jgi:hypothetical protein